MKNPNYSHKGESRYIAFDHSPPRYIFDQEVSVLVMLPSGTDTSFKISTCISFINSKQKTMKTIMKLLLAIACVCMLFACSKSNDDPVDTSKQLKSESTRSYAYKWNTGWYCDVFCDGVWIDYLEGTGYGQFVDHYTNGVWQWEIINFKGTATNLAGETFTFNEQDKIFAKTLPILWTCHANIKGDKGALYNISFIFTYDQNWNLTSWQVKNATCTGNTN